LDIGPTKTMTVAGEYEWPAARRARHPQNPAHHA
jgi:hypothetical protein